MAQTNVGRNNDKENTPVEQGGTKGPWVPETPVTGRLRATLSAFDFSAKGTVTERATASAERIIALGPSEPDEKKISASDRRKSLLSLGAKAENVDSATLKIIVKDKETNCSDFGLDKEKLTESQAKILLNEILEARADRHQRKHEILLRFVSAFFGFFAGLLTHLLK